MGLNLDLHVLRNIRELRGGETVQPVQVLHLNRAPQIFAQLKRIDGYPDPVIKIRDMPVGMCIFKYQDGELVESRTNPYHEDLVFCFASDLKGLSLPAEASPMNRAVMAFIKELPDTTPLVLEWR